MNYCQPKISECPAIPLGVIVMVNPVRSVLHPPRVQVIVMGPSLKEPDSRFWEYRGGCWKEVPDAPQ